MRLTPTALTMEEMSKIWTVFPNTPYNLSVSYSASVVFIERELEPIVPELVLERKVEVGILSASENLPTNILGLGLWLRSDKGLSRKIDGSILWLDQSGNERHASQDHVANAPRVIPNAIGSRSVVNFEGVHDRLALQWSIAGPVTGVTVCAIIRSSGTGDRTIISFDRAIFWELGVTSDPSQVVWRTPSDALAAASVPLGEGWHVLYATFDAKAPEQKGLRVDHGEPVFTSPSPGNALAGNARFGIIGASSSAATFNGAVGTSFFRGDIAELIIFERGLQEQERSSLFRYLSDQYGIP